MEGDELTGDEGEGDEGGGEDHAGAAKTMLMLGSRRKPGAEEAGASEAREDGKIAPETTGRRAKWDIDEGGQAC